LVFWEAYKRPNSNYAKGRNIAFSY